MIVENIYPHYENEQEREKKLEEIHTQMQILLYNKKREQMLAGKERKQRNEI
ncbi:unknown [Clostridium sp. CAG:149]|nr:unknown [Clostridium sp. CAG:149]